MTNYDVIIIGGGVMGSATAFFLASNPDFDGRVAVIERDPSYEFAPSSRATGGFRQQFSTPENIQMGLFGAQFVKDIDRHLSVDDEPTHVIFNEGGYLLLASPERLAMMREQNVTQIAHGADVHFQSPEALHARFPWFDAIDLAGGFLGLTQEGWVDPYSLLQAFRRKAIGLGAEFVADEVTSIAIDGRQATGVNLKSGITMSAGHVVNAAGAHGTAALAEACAAPVPIEPRKRAQFYFECREPVLGAPLTIFPSGVGFRPEGKGFLSVLAPEPAEDHACSDYEVDYALFEDGIWPTLAAHIPAFEAIKLINAFCCHYDFNTLDENAIVGFTPALDNYLVATGFSGHGLQQSPAVGRALSELVCYQEFRTIDLTRFGYERVLSGTAIRESNCY